MRVALLVAAALAAALPLSAQSSCDGGPAGCGITIPGIVTAGACPTGCGEFSRTHEFNVFGNTTLMTLTAESSTFVPTIEVETAGGQLIDRREGRSGSPTRLQVVLQPGVHLARIIAPPGTSGGYTLRLGCLLADPEVFCAPSDTTLCLYSRFSARVTLRAGDSGTAAGAATKISDRYGVFSAPSLTSDPDNPEVLVKILDGRPVNGRWWVFIGGLTGFDYDVTIRDTFYKREKTYTKAEVAAMGGVDLTSFPDR